MLETPDVLGRSVSHDPTIAGTVQSCQGGQASAPDIAAQAAEVGRSRRRGGAVTAVEHAGLAGSHAHRSASEARGAWPSELAVYKLLPSRSLRDESARV